MTGDHRQPFSIPDFLSLAETPEDVDEKTAADAARLLQQLSDTLLSLQGPGPTGMTWPDQIDGESEQSLNGVNVEARLRAAEKRFRTLVEQIPAVTFMAVLGEGENEVYVSPHIEQMLGFTQEEWLANPFQWYYQLHPDDRALWNEEFARGCRTGGPFRAECRFISRDGSTVWVHGEARVVKDDRGRMQFLQGVAFDITESKRAQEVLLTTAVRQAKADEELEIARRLQTALIPKTPRLEGLEIGAVMNPADEVGGDYYDVLKTPDGGWIAIGDVSGHGLTAGLVMLMLQSAMMTVTKVRLDVSPREALAHVNDVLFDNVSRRLNRSNYVTLSLLRYTLDGQIEVAGAHQDILVWRARSGTVECIATQGPWVAIRPQIRSLVTSHKFTLEPGDLMVLYTDGVIEPLNDKGELFGLTRLCEHVRAVGDREPLDVCEYVAAEVRKWWTAQEDDLTVVAARYSP